jgi:Zn-finger nucleic acid-binding protein
MRCPKCAGEMVTYERSGIHVDQCRECRGMFLDRGELERLADAESAANGWAGPSMRAPAPVSSPAADPRSDQRRDSRDDPRDDRRDGYRPDRYRGDDDDDDRYRFDRDDRDDRDDRRGRDDRGSVPRKRRGLIGELLEGFGE